MVGDREDRQLLLAAEEEVHRELEEDRWGKGRGKDMGVGDKRIEVLRVFSIVRDE